MDVRFFLCLFIFVLCLLEVEWCWGIFPSNSASDIYHMNLQYAIQLCWLLGD